MSSTRSQTPPKLEGETEPASEERVFATPSETDKEPAPTCIEHRCRLSPQHASLRLDQVAAELFPDYSRAKLQGWIKTGELTLDERRVKPNYKVTGLEQLQLSTTLLPEGDWLPEPMDLVVVYEDTDILVINKPAGLVVHPAAGNWQGTLLNGLIYHYPALKTLPRAGIVHRLDKDTSGLMVVAKTLRAQTSLVEQLQARSVGRHYCAFVMGCPPKAGYVEANIGRHPSARTKMAVVSGGKEAMTHYRRVAKYGDVSKLHLKLETGRTHQIRVHLTHIGHSLIGDPVYVCSGRRQADVSDSIRDFPRQALHAFRLSLTHPVSEALLSWEVALPDDMCVLESHLAEACGDPDS